MSWAYIQPLMAAACSLLAGWLFGRLTPAWQGDAIDDSAEPQVTEHGVVSNGDGGCLLGMFYADWRLALLMTAAAIAAGWLWFDNAYGDTPFSAWWVTGGTGAGYLLAVMTNEVQRPNYTR